jgi:hypothetical protein
MVDLGRSTSPPGDITTMSLRRSRTSGISSSRATTNHFFRSVKTPNLLNIWTRIPWNRWSRLVPDFGTSTVFSAYSFKMVRGAKSEGLRCLSSTHLLWIQQDVRGLSLPKLFQWLKFNFVAQYHAYCGLSNRYSS